MEINASFSLCITYSYEFSSSLQVYKVTRVIIQAI